MQEFQGVMKTTIVVLEALKNKGLLNDDDLKNAYESISKQRDSEQGSDSEDSDSDVVDKIIERSEVQPKEAGTNEGRGGPLRSPLL